MSSIDIYSIIAQPIPTTQSKTKVFISKAKVVHGDLYNYDLVEYINNKTKVKIICHTHGIFEQTPDKHLIGQRCIDCSIIIRVKLRTSNIEDFVIKANSIHNDEYNYDIVTYINARIKVKIICKIHGIFEQTPDKHLSGKPCHKCNNRSSKISTKWLESLDIVDMIQEYRLPENTKKPVDGYSLSTNTVYQFHGDYWHGNPIKYNSEDMNKRLKKTYGELYEKTIESDLWILSLGYNLVTMWESDFN